MQDQKNKFIALGLVVVAGFVAFSILKNKKIETQASTFAVDKTTDRPLEAFAETKAPIANKKVKLKKLDASQGSVVVLNTEVSAESANLIIKGISDANTNAPGKPIFLLLDSPGGSVLDGARVIAAMQSSKAPVYTVCMQICASMAAMILEYGTERYAVDRSVIMFHPASVGGMFQGELDKVVSRFAFLKRFVDKMDYHTAERSGESYASFKAKSTQELWIDAEDALASKYIDAIVKIEYDIAPKLDFGSNKAREKMTLSW